MRIGEVRYPPLSHFLRCGGGVPEDDRVSQGHIDHEPGRFVTQGNCVSWVNLEIVRAKDGVAFIAADPLPVPAVDLSLDDVKTDPVNYLV